MGSITVKNGSFTSVDAYAKPIWYIQEETSKRTKKRKLERSDSKKLQGMETSDEYTSVQSGYSVSSGVSAASSVKGPTVTLQNLDMYIEAGSLVANGGESVLESLPSCLLFSVRWSP
jgi:hypothetical protein